MTRNQQLGNIQRIKYLSRIYKDMYVICTLKALLYICTCGQYDDLDIQETRV